MAQDNQNQNREIGQESHEFLRQLYPLIRNYRGQRPNLRDIFRPEAIDWLLSDIIQRTSPLPLSVEDALDREAFVDFVARSGYEDVPPVDENGAPLVLRTTPIHHAARCEQNQEELVANLLAIYGQSVNYVDPASGLTHFQVACLADCHSDVGRFLELRAVDGAGPDPNDSVMPGGQLPLHWALYHGKRELAATLLRHGADPTQVDDDRLNAVHHVCMGNDDFRTAKLFFDVIDEIRHPLEIDAKDRFGWTALVWAVANLKPRLVDLLFARGASLANFVFPSERQFGDLCAARCEESPENFLLRQASSALLVVEHLEARGYEMSPDNVWTVHNFFARNRLFEEPLDPEDLSWYDNEEFAMDAPGITFVPGLSLYDLVRLRPEEAEQSLTCSDYWRFGLTNQLTWLRDPEHRQVCARHLCDKLSRGFFRRWGFDLLHNGNNRIVEQPIDERA
ncbi:uncharacterized protein LOC106657735 [Trichogramma pretiosum]|uniref:uncharacterized protein LOC106657735 n=1 Tax=Trichogramma pretiosum TaxID=7493 RepID=UPI0006C94C03|nr:uncharacterized protein LOC106657735 [Trichogramma pretiosum]